MIDEIKLNKFGKFTNKSFKISPITFFYGENEAGKTTIFDSLLIGLCNPPKTIAIAKELYSRYEDNCLVELIFDNNEEIKIDISEFLNLYAVRSGDVNFDLSSKGDWIDRVKSNLFSGGIDPKKLIEKFEKLGSHNKTLIHNKELSDLQNKKEVLTQKLIKLKSDRNIFLSKENDINSSKDELFEIKSDLENIQKEKQNLENQIQNIDKIKEYNGLKSVLDDIYKKENLEIKINSLSYFKNDESLFLKNKNEEVSSLQNEINKIYIQISNLSQNINKNIEQKKEIEKNKKNYSSYIGIVNDFLKEITEFRNNPPLKKFTAFNLIFIILSIVVSFSGILTAFFTGIYWFYFSTIVGVIIFILGKKDNLSKDIEKEKDFINRVKDNFRNRVSISLISETFDGLYEELIKIRNDSDSVERITNEKDFEINELRIELDKYKDLKFENEEKIKFLRNNIEDWFKNKGIINYDEYRDKMKEYNMISLNLMEINKKVNNLVDFYKVKDFIDLKNESERKLRSLDDENISNKEIDEITYNNLKMQLKNVENKSEVINQKRENIEKNIVGNTENVRVSLGDIPNNIIVTEEEINEIDIKIDNYITDKKAANTLKNIFEEISNDSNSVLKELSTELKNQFGEINPDMRDVEVDNLDLDSISMTDAGGQKRAIAHLSRGTKDSFIFATRLLFALKSSNNQNNILILDEPFHSFDEKRELKSLEMLKKFQEKNNWQIILFTKEQRMISNSKKIFKNKLLLHNLS